jgi:hypothetical protein
MSILRRLDVLERQVRETDAAPPLPGGTAYLLDLFIKGCEEGGGPEHGKAARVLADMVKSDHLPTRNRGLEFIIRVVESAP